MPGGLTRVAASADTLVVSMQQGGGSKDTWVLSAGPVSTFSLLPPRPAAGGTEPRRRRPAQPGGRQPLLARPLRRAGRGAGPAAARHPGPADGKVGPGRRAGAAGAAPRPDAPGAGPIPASSATGPRRGWPRRRRSCCRSSSTLPARQPAGRSTAAAPGRRHGPRPHLDRHVAHPRPPQARRPMAATPVARTPKRPHGAAGPTVAAGTPQRRAGAARGAARHRWRPSAVWRRRA